MEVDAQEDSNGITVSTEASDAQLREKENELAKARQMLGFLVESGIVEGQKQVKGKIEKLEEEVLQMSQSGKIAKEMRLLEDEHSKIMENMRAMMKQVLDEEAVLAKRKDAISTQMKEEEDAYLRKKKELGKSLSQYWLDVSAKYIATSKPDTVSPETAADTKMQQTNRNRKEMQSKKKKDLGSPASKPKEDRIINANVVTQAGCVSSAVDDSSGDKASEDACTPKLAADDESEEGQPSLDPLALEAPHLDTSAAPVEYEIVIPTYQRWRSVSWVTGKRRCRRYQDPERAFILENTLRFLSRDGVPKCRVTLFVANDDEASSYAEALRGSEWADVRIKISAPGIRDSRNAICKHFSEGTYIVSLDDDISCVFWKVKEGNDAKCLRRLPPGAFQKLIFDAYQRMKTTGAFLWGVNTSANPRCLALSGVSVRNGLVNGYLHGFIARPQCDELLRSLRDAVEDCEFSVRHFAKDGIVLRYRMYCASTSCYANAGGLQAKFSPLRTPPCVVNSDETTDAVTEKNEAKCCARKLEEIQGALELHELFPHLIAPPEKKSEDPGRKATMAVRFIKKITKSAGCDKVLGKRSKMRGKHSKLKLSFIRGKSKNLKFNSSCASVIGKNLRKDDSVKYGFNTKASTSQAFVRYEKYKHARTIGEAKECGANREDLRYDAFFGYMKILNLDSAPASSECIVQDNDVPVGKVPAIASSKLHAITVRIKEMEQSQLSLKLPREDLVLLANRCGPAVRSCPTSRWGERTGPLANVPLDIVRVLLHWGKTGTLSYCMQSSVALSDALTACGVPEVAMRARCIEVASGQSSLVRFFPSSGVPGLSAETSRSKAAASMSGSRVRGKIVPEVGEIEAKSIAAKSLAHYFGARAATDGIVQ